jgi:hypothetical protein
MDRPINHERRIKVLAIVTALLLIVLVAMIVFLEFDAILEIHD